MELHTLDIYKYGTLYIAHTGFAGHGGHTHVLRFFLKLPIDATNLDGSAFGSSQPGLTERNAADFALIATIILKEQKGPNVTAIAGSTRPAFSRLYEQKERRAHVAPPRRRASGGKRWKVRSHRNKKFPRAAFSCVPTYIGNACLRHPLGGHLPCPAASIE